MNTETEVGMDAGDDLGGGSSVDPSLTSGSEVVSGGPRWLKYSGVGSRRKSNASGALSGAAVTSLGSLEAEVMAAVWDIGRPATGMEVMEHSLYKRRSQGEEPAAFATIATTLRRLTQKGLLTSEKNAQRTPVFAPTVGREEMAARVLNNVSETLLGDSLHALLPRLVGRESVVRRESGALSKPPPSGTSDIAVDELLRALEDLADREAEAAPEESMLREEPPSP